MSFYLIWFFTFCFLCFVSFVVLHWQWLFTHRKIYRQRDVFRLFSIFGSQLRNFLPLDSDRPSVEVIVRFLSIFAAFLFTGLLILLGGILGEVRQLSASSLPNFLHPSWINYYLQSALILFAVYPAIYFFRRLLANRFIHFSLSESLIKSQPVFLIIFMECLLSLQISSWLLYRNFNGWYVLGNSLVLSYVIFWQWQIIRKEKNEEKSQRKEREKGKQARSGESKEVVPNSNPAQSDKPIKSES